MNRLSKEIAEQIVSGDADRSPWNHVTIEEMEAAYENGSLD
ncbi:MULTISPECIES: hypothetical protein [Paenibacillaceae]|nr:hypothetical protein [Paenibacillus sp. oral taxon 786]